MSRGGVSSKQLAEQLYQIQSDNHQWRLGMTDDEFEEYPDWISTKLFQVSQIECPILWVRVDPDVETIRRVKVLQTQNSWLYQLLQDRDYIGQIEACKELKNYDDKFVYNILQQIAMNEKYFFKVRKHALRSLQEINVRTFDNYLSHEKTFLVFYFNQRNYNEKIGYYRSNEFTNMLEYYVNTYMIRALAKSKEKELPLKEDVRQLLASSKKSVANTGHKKGANDGAIDGRDPHLLAPLDFLANHQKDLTIDDAGSFGGMKLGDSANKDGFDPRDFCVTSDLICRLMIRLLQENDNSENPFDDSFYLSKILANLGKLDNFDYMP